MMTTLNQTLHTHSNSDKYSSLEMAHEIIREHGIKLGSIPMMSPINFYYIEGQVWCTMSYTQIQYSGEYRKWREPEGFIPCARTQHIGE